MTVQMKNAQNTTKRQETKRPKSTPRFQRQTPCKCRSCTHKAHLASPERTPPGRTLMLQLRLEQRKWSWKSASTNCVRLPSKRLATESVDLQGLQHGTGQSYGNYLATGESVALRLQVDRQAPLPCELFLKAKRLQCIHCTSLAANCKILPTISEKREVSCSFSHVTHSTFHLNLLVFTCFHHMMTLRSVALTQGNPRALQAFGAQQIPAGHHLGLLSLS